MTLSISIDRTSLGLEPLVLSGDDDANPLGVAAYQEPGRQVRVAYMPDSVDIHGSEARAWSWQQGLMSFEVFPSVATEAAADALIDEVVAAVTQFSYTVTVTRAGAPRTWSADPGSVSPVGGRTVDDLTDHDASHAVEIPVYPIPS